MYLLFKGIGYTLLILSYTYLFWIIFLAIKDKRTIHRWYFLEKNRVREWDQKDSHAKQYFTTLGIYFFSLTLMTVYIFKTFTSHSEASSSRFHNLQIQVGDPRSKAEEAIAMALFHESTYSPHGNNLRGGVVKYRDNQWILEIDYLQGTPAPFVENSEGITHLPPTEEAVKSIKIYRP